MYYIPSVSWKLSVFLTQPESVKPVSLSMKNQKQATRCVRKITEPKMNKVYLIEYPSFIALEKLVNLENFKTLANLSNLKILNNLYSRGILANLIIFCLLNVLLSSDVWIFSMI